MDIYLFYALSVLMIFSSIMVLVSKKGIHSLLYLIFSSICRCNYGFISVFGYVA